mmetsp:Transcript_24178/g.23756  ORF Transcript_24178/g.23756 Transcript_24178/m.23756 type:complete len:114 (+) Transcript_24178:1091-1432(+)
MAWRTELIGDLQYDKAAKKLEFTTKKLSPLAYIQPRTTDYPYKSWKLRCIEDEVALLDIETKRLTLTFKICAQSVMLIEKSDVELKDLVNKPMTAGRLLLELVKCGINLMPVD